MALVAINREKTMIIVDTPISHRVKRGRLTDFVRHEERYVETAFSTYDLHTLTFFRRWSLQWHANERAQDF